MHIDRTKGSNGTWAAMLYLVSHLTPKRIKFSFLGLETPTDPYIDVWLVVVGVDVAVVVIVVVTI